MRMLDLIRKKKTGQELTKEEIEFFCEWLCAKCNSRLSSYCLAYEYMV